MAPEVQEPMPCPECGEGLTSTRTRHGLVWRCADCGGAAATLGVLRRVVPRPFLRHLWRAALEHATPIELRCPSCRQPLLTFSGPVEVEPRCQICCRCFFVWLDSAAFGSLALAPRGLPKTGSQPTPAPRRVPDGPEILEGLERALAEAHALAERLEARAGERRR